jgi:aromatic amino acid aminotransferase II
MTIDLSRHFNDSKYKGTDFYSVNPPDIEVHSEPINLSGGRPNAGFYPIGSIELNIKAHPFSPEDAPTTKFIIKNKDVNTLDIANGLQYGPSLGHPQLVDFIKQLIADLNPPKHDLELGYLVTNGSGDSLFRILQILLNPGETILVEEFTYTPIFGPIKSLGGVKIPYKVKFKSDSDVIDTDYLSDLLNNWNSNYPDLPKPKLIYSVPTQNPSGLTQPLKTRVKLYEIAKEHDLIILEDDPDGYIRLNELDSFNKYKSNITGGSYLNLDTDGRVIRFETFSKLYSPGLRLGFIVAIKPLIAKLDEFTKVATKASSGFSQLIFYNTLKFWKHEDEDLSNIVEGLSVNQDYGSETSKLVDGYLKWCLKVSKEYSKRWNFVFSLLKESKSFRNGYIELVEPDGGMFFVININFPNGTKDGAASLEKLRHKLIKYGVLVILGNLMTWEDESSKNAKFVRLTLANVDSLQELRSGIERFDEGVIEYFTTLK